MQLSISKSAALASSATATAAPCSPASVSGAPASSATIAAAPCSSASVSGVSAYPVIGCGALVAPETPPSMLSTTAVAALADQQQELKRPKTALTATATATAEHTHTSDRNCKTGSSSNSISRTRNFQPTPALPDCLSNIKFSNGRASNTVASAAHAPPATETAAAQVAPAIAQTSTSASCCYSTGNTGSY
jgi:hypothetical protein